MNRLFITSLLTTFIIVRITNLNNETDLTIKNIKFLGLDHRVIKESKIEQRILNCLVII